MDFYDIDEVIGKGTYSLVRRAVHLDTGDTVAIKIGIRELDFLKRESKILSRISHPHIVKFIESGPGFLAMEYVEGGEIFYLLEKEEKFSESRAREYAKQIVSAVEYLHNQNISHGDIKPENIFVTCDGNLKLGDFGFARFFDKEMISINTGTPEYCAPEILYSTMQHPAPTDVWSVGVVIYMLLTGHFPFDNRIPGKTGDYYKSRLLSEKAKDLFDKIFVLDPSNRLTISEVAAHPWFYV